MCIVWTEDLQTQALSMSAVDYKHLVTVVVCGTSGEHCIKRSDIDGGYLKNTRNAFCAQEEIELFIEHSTHYDFLRSNFLSWQFKEHLHFQKASALVTFPFHTSLFITSSY